MIKKLVGLILVVGTLFSVFAVSASAAYQYFSFDVTTSVNTGKGFSSQNIKDDYDEYAHVETTNANISTGDKYYYRVMCSRDASTPASEYYRITRDNKSYVKMLYYDGYAWAGAKRYLMGDSDLYSVKSSGYWWS